MRLTRAGGVLLHPTSLPGPFGVGDLGPEAEAFVDVLVETGQRWWQMLPVGPIGAEGSPYQSFSSHAGNALLISPERLLEEGWVDRADLETYPTLPDDRVEFSAVREAKADLLARAFRRFNPSEAGFEDFRSANASWLDDYALFMALKDASGGAPWYEWDVDLVRRRPEALARARARHNDAVFFYQFEQYVFARQFEALRSRCRSREIGLIGDVPIFVARDSADVWGRPDLFHLDESGRPTVVAGVPPDYFAAEGQLWGNPLYRWESHAAEGFAWWLDRMRAATARFELVRLDHFRGFEAYWEVPADAPTAVTGRWQKGPGIAFLEALREGLGGLPLIAEDLGDITAEVLALRDRFGLPGMRVLQFGFGGDPKWSQHLPHFFVPNCVAYTGTHDNDTSLGWYRAEGPDSAGDPAQVEAVREFARVYLGSDGRAFHREAVRAVATSVADTAIFPVQDLLGLGGSARMNVPGRAGGNWGWRMAAGALSAEVRARLAETTAVSGRWNGDPPPGLRFPRVAEAEA